VPDHQLIAFGRDDDYIFGVLHSKPHELWARRLGTQLREVESGFRYTPTTCFETFPLPTPTAEQEAAVAEAARHLDSLREGWRSPTEGSDADGGGRTFTALYNDPPTWLTQAHDQLDEAVHGAYGWPYPLADEEVLIRLNELNLSESSDKVETEPAVPVAEAAAIETWVSWSSSALRSSAGASSPGSRWV
jgi:hypothetical protein